MTPLVRSKMLVLCINLAIATEKAPSEAIIDVSCGILLTRHGPFGSLVFALRTVRWCFLQDSVEGQR